jgi:hypothetical protein
MTGEGVWEVFVTAAELALVHRKPIKETGVFRRLFRKSKESSAK